MEAKLKFLGRPDLMRPLNNSHVWFKEDPELPIPKTTTHDTYVKPEVKYMPRAPFKKIVNFQSYTSSGFHFEDEGEAKPPKMHLALSTTYEREFTNPKPLECQEREIFMGETPDFLFNRRPVNEFDSSRWKHSKFMDDHFSSPSEERQKINFFRQLRNTSNIFPDQN